MQTCAETVELLHPQRVALLHPRRVVGTGLEVDVYLVFGDAAGHQLSVAAEDVSTTGLHTHTVALQSRSHLLPILLLRRHDIEGLADDSKPYQCHHYRDGEIAGHHFIVPKPTHLYK